MRNGISRCLAVLVAMAAAGPASGGEKGAADGAAVFTARCAYCHGADGKGLPRFKAKGQPDFSSAAWQGGITDTAIADGIRKGKGAAMPAYGGKISEPELQALVKRIREFRK